MRCWRRQRWQVTILPSVYLKASGALDRDSPLAPLADRIQSRLDFKWIVLSQLKKKQNFSSLPEKLKLFGDESMQEASTNDDTSSWFSNFSMPGIAGGLIKTEITGLWTRGFDSVGLGFEMGAVAGICISRSPPGIHSLLLWGLLFEKSLVWSILFLKRPSLWWWWW